MSKEQNTMSVVKFTKQAIVGPVVYVAGDKATFDHGLAEAIEKTGRGTIEGEVKRPDPVSRTSEQIASSINEERLATIIAKAISETMAAANKPVLEAMAVVIAGMAQGTGTKKPV